jgi:hypothetical protein
MVRNSTQHSALGRGGGARQEACELRETVATTVATLLGRPAKAVRNGYSRLTAGATECCLRSLNSVLWGTEGNEEH